MSVGERAIACVREGDDLALSAAVQVVVVVCGEALVSAASRDTCTVHTRRPQPKVRKAQQQKEVGSVTTYLARTLETSYISAPPPFPPPQP